MNSKDDSPISDLTINALNNISSPNKEQNINVPNIPSLNANEKNAQLNLEETEQRDINFFNISFFLPKDLCKNIVVDEGNSENKNNHEINNNYNYDSLDKNNNNINQNNDFDLSLNNNKYLDINQNSDYFNFQSNSQNINDNNSNQNKNEINNTNYNDELNYLRIGDQDRNFFPTNTSINNFFINNNNNSPINLQFNNSPFPHNNLNIQNNSNLLNFTQISNNQPLNGCDNGLYNQNIINKFYFNNNGEISNFFTDNQFHQQNARAIQRNNNNIQRNKKVIDDYTIEMFGRIGWICQMCNNFNYDTRKKCNRCHIAKKPKKIKDYLQAEKNRSMGYKHYWHCKYCGNNNFAFRLVCNRCQAKKEVF